MQDAGLGLSLAKGGAAALLTRPPPQASATFLAFVGLSTEQCSRVLRMSALTDLMVTFSLLQGHEQQIVQCGCGHACDGIAEMSYIHMQKMKLRPHQMTMKSFVCRFRYGRQLCLCVLFVQGGAAALLTRPPPQDLAVVQPMLFTTSVHCGRESF